MLGVSRHIQEEKLKASTTGVGSIQKDEDNK